MYGPQVPACDAVHASKHRLPNESFEESCARQAAALADSESHRQTLKLILLHQRFLGAGRVQASVGSPRNVTAFNCFVSGTIKDSMESIMGRATEAAETMRRGGGIGYDFSRLRPSGDRIVSLDSSASGAVSFMHIYDAICRTISSAGHRRGAMMGVLRVDHPDIEEFIRAKRNETVLTNFNISVGVTDGFLDAVSRGGTFDLSFGGKSYNTVDARALWDEIMRSNWEWAEPGVLFLDRINDYNPLNYCETIEASNPCGEQPLPPFGACLLGSFNLIKYVGSGHMNYGLFKEDIPHIVRAMDNVIEHTTYPLGEQEIEAKLKRRMGLGITGLANALTLCGLRYGSKEAVRFVQNVMRTLRNTAIEASCELAKEKGHFPVYNEEYRKTKYFEALPKVLQNLIKKNGIRNSHLISIAPCGTISFTADNISSGIEPVFSQSIDRTVLTPNGSEIVQLQDYVYRTTGKVSETADELSTDEHLDMQIAVQPYVDSAVSKTINVGNDVTFDEFKDIYMKAWKGGLKGCTTFRLAGKRYGVLNKTEVDGELDGAACFVDPNTGEKECS
jgi:ribonucleoside-diphosphate reductase alpha chain